MNNFTITLPTEVLFGKGQIHQLGERIHQFGKKVLLVYGKGSIKRNGVFDAVTEELEKHAIEYVELSGVDPNPRISTVRQGVALCREENIDFILAIGGGSSIDCAKVIAIGAKYDGDPWDFFSGKAVPTDGVPLGAVLTLAATGSEMNSGSVITNEETQQKHILRHPHQTPKVSVLDPTYTFTVPSRQTACGVVDALTHIYEFYFNQKETADLTDRISETIMKNIIKYGPIAMREPDNYEARANLMWASSLALNGLTKLGKEFDGFNHITEHALSAIYDITHAEGLSILAPHWMEYVLDDSTVQRFHTFAKNVWDIQREDPYEAAKEAIEKVTNFYKELDMPTKLAQVGIDDQRIDEIVEKSFFGPTLGTFKVLYPEDVKNIVLSAM